ILLSGDPLSLRSKVLGTWVEGQRVFDRSKAEDRLLAVGGWGASHGQHLHLCCADDDDHGADD
ncbi:MAG: hypothetical protein KDB53_09005, partial [Planctomycetes bacterium]|nr:hypothetical protein [Planctomycetota bacterium]